MTDPGTLATYREYANEYRERNADRSAVAPLVERFLAAVDGATNDAARLLDVGCGPGWETRTFAARGHDAFGIDLTPDFLRIARRAVREETVFASFARMDMRRLAFDPGTFDGVWACASLLHVPREDVPATFADFHRVCRSGGVLHVSVKQGDGERDSDVYADDRRRFTLYQPDDLCAMATEAGFTAQSIRTEDGWVQLLARA